ncbi:Alpha/beta hydrolase family protein [Planctomycetes bacterium K23_9]|uniref:Alpha/beta hydrolase family protein n=1 Tax=Stieleria marina TaxID=1930275 RepID=A0A517P2N2_9BACT|nr:Alpha/beta hydrolase family protein [Planctomycetes bacterium K23_9]
MLVIHGFTCHRIWLTPTCRRLQRKGYRTDNWGYKSFFRSIQVHGDALHTHLVNDLATEERIDILAHSMGSLVTRYALSKGGISNLGRIVLIAPPSRGTPVARFVAPLIGGISKCVREMSDAANSFASLLPTSIPNDVGVVTAKFDHLVPNRCTHIDCERDHTTLWATHNSLLFSPQVTRLADHFFRHGRFFA